MNMQWYEEMACAVTICDLEANIIYMNQKAKKTFAKYGNDIIGRNLREFHGDRAWEIIQQLIRENSENHYTIQKGDLKKIIHQMPYYNNGKVIGLVEFSFEIPTDTPNYTR